MEITSLGYKPISPQIIYSKMKIKLNILLFAALLFQACKQDSELKMDTVGPKLILIQPQKDSIYLSLTNLPVIVDIIENDQLHSMAVKIVRDKDSVIVFSKHTHLHYQNYLYETSMLLPEVDSLEFFSIELLATDHSGNSNTKNLRVGVKNN